jgi:hypothetical protein
MYGADGPVAPLEGQRVRGGQGNPAGSIGVVAVVVINGVLGEDVRVFYPLIVIQTVTLVGMLEAVRASELSQPWESGSLSMVRMTDAP